METIKISGDTPFFWQWDIDRRVELSGAENGYVIHFVQEGGEQGCLTVEPYKEEGRWFAAVPNLLLQTAAPIHVYLYRATGRTLCRAVFHVEPRERPEDYIYTETAVRTWETLSQAVADLAASLPAPAYIRDEGERTARVVLGHQGPDTFSLAFLADMHCGFTYEVNDTWVVDDTAVVEAGQGLAVLAETAPVDAVVLGGDLAVGHWKSDRAEGLTRLDDCARYMHEGADRAPVFYLRGNHDDAPCMATEERLTARDLYGRIGRKNQLAGAVMGAGCYGYRDFENQKMRVLLLDTDDTADWNSVQTGAGDSCPYLDAANISAAQLRFLAERALDFSDKAAPGEWGILVCSHRPLDVADATYTDPITGESFTAGTGNVVQLLVDYLYKNANAYTHNGESVEYDFSTLTETATIYCCVHGHNHAYRYSLLGGVIPSIGCPNVMNGRERVSDDGNTYAKTPGTARSTAFCVITVDRGQNRIYADHFGSGVDREWEFVPLEMENGYVNLLPQAVDADGTVYNGCGYKEGYRLNSSATETADANFTLTGFIPVSEGDTVYLKNITYNSAASNAGNQRMAFYNAEKVLIGTVYHAGVTAIMGRVYDENNNLIRFSASSWSGGDLTGLAYFRMNGTYIGADSVITVNQPIL